MGGDRPLWGSQELGLGWIMSEILMGALWKDFTCLSLNIANTPKRNPPP